jgi:hypothetical protein
MRMGSLVVNSVIIKGAELGLDFISKSFTTYWPQVCFSAPVSWYMGVPLSMWFSSLMTLVVVCFVIYYFVSTVFTRVALSQFAVTAVFDALLVVGIQPTIILIQRIQ